MLKTETASASFQKCKNHAQGETHKFLQQIDVPVLDSNLKLTDQ